MVARSLETRGHRYWDGENTETPLITLRSQHLHGLVVGYPDITSTLLHNRNHTNRKQITRLQHNQTKGGESNEEDG